MLYAYEGPVMQVAARQLASVTDQPIPVPDPQRLIHLQFRRFAGCPVCHLHIGTLIRRRDEIDAAGIREVLVFHSPAEELREHAPSVPFDLVADPDKRLYREFGVTEAPRALLDPRVWPAILRAVVRSVVQILRRRERPPSVHPHGGRIGLPADFLIAPDGSVLAHRYGAHAYDQWSVDELLALAAGQDTGPDGTASPRQRAGRSDAGQK
ncbi:peroxiredoxin-like family protein [Jidongwangia harbinensis]|uniref:peroxiredoxin-like family protein n=1 Tax=Jidongwangia harbinensis TaxID=2878561 RepID=UPI001CD9E40D|nr:peroxiredoxin-like family protein [Jidongwangia harbinensis]MCA2213614.1 AhpC/TSA family protein [Jidongwangia harbinensis]